MRHLDIYDQIPLTTKGLDRPMSSGQLKKGDTMRTAVQETFRGMLFDGNKATALSDMSNKWNAGPTAVVTPGVSIVYR